MDFSNAPVDNLLQFLNAPMEEMTMTDIENIAYDLLSSDSDIDSIDTYSDLSGGDLIHDSQSGYNSLPDSLLSDDGSLPDSILSDYDLSSASSEEIADQIWEEMDDVLPISVPKAPKKNTKSHKRKLRKKRSLPTSPPLQHTTTRTHKMNLRNKNNNNTLPDDFYIVDKIVDHIRGSTPARWKFKVHWADYDSSTDTWEPTKNVCKTTAFAHYIRERNLAAFPRSKYPINT